MEYMHFGDLQQYINYRSFPEPEAASIARQIAQALRYMHERNFVHRDLKPQNILVAEPGPRWRIKLADFGLAKSVDGTVLATQAIGTRGYMAPELLEESTTEYTAAVDIWALGAVVFCMRTRISPFPSNRRLIDYLDHHQRELITGPLKNSSRYCADFVLGAMAPEVQSRFTIRQVLAHAWLFMQPMVEGQGSAEESTMATTAWDQVDSNAWASTVFSGSSGIQPGPGPWIPRHTSVSPAPSISSPEPFLGNTRKMSSGGESSRNPQQTRAFQHKSRGSPPYVSRQPEQTVVPTRRAATSSSLAAGNTSASNDPWGSRYEAEPSGTSVRTTEGERGLDEGLMHEFGDSAQKPDKIPNKEKTSITLQQRRDREIRDRLVHDFGYTEDEVDGILIKKHERDQKVKD
ncbi:kinase-like domain-containing protein [Aspergillus multicolor]|uniref:kinase-like domain-containing protein n=1 Tax=Aspergillus multicolor TaxID=41759 RepID=UPI003CCDBEBA